MNNSVNLHDYDCLTEKIIGAAIEVHKHLGPGLLESAYEECLCYELKAGNALFERQKVLPILYKGNMIDARYRVDIIVQGVIPIEIKAVQALHPVHDAQILTYMKIGGWEVGLLINFNVPLLKNGIKRIINNRDGG